MINSTSIDIEFALRKIKALADAAQFLNGSDEEKSLSLEIMDIISLTAEAATKNG
ncbi:hypothetical protein [Rahnella inusitata]|uniref:hypothetical protein n=1 Tax=Rahnella inusitata TaxID=58169 RepID=UPI0039BE2BDA